MAWPDDADLPIGFFAAFGADLTAHPASWVFTNLTDRAKALGKPVQIRKATSAGAADTSPGTCTVVAGNDDGELTPDHPGSSFWPYVDMNVPIMTTIDHLTPVNDSDSWSTSSSNSWGTSDQGRTWHVFGAGGSVLASDWQVAGGAATASVPTTVAYRAAYIDVGAADVDVVCTVSASVTPTGGAIEPGNLMLRIQDATRYYLARVSVAPGGAITASLHAIGGSDELASATVTGLSWSSGVALRVRAQAWDRWLRMRVWRASDPEPVTWHVVTEADDYPLPGGVGSRDGIAFGNTNSKPIVFSHDNFEITELPWIRFDGFADSWVPTYTPTSDGTFVSSVRLTASGILRRLTQGTSPAQSALYRSYDGAESVIAWWSMEDGEKSSYAASGVEGVPPLVPSDVDPLWTTGNTGSVAFGVDASGTGAASLVSMAGGGQLTAPIPASTATSWRVDFSARFKAGTGSATVMNPLSWFGGSVPGTGKPYEFTWQFSTTQIVFAGADPDGFSGVILTAAINAYDSKLHHYTIEAYQDGANVDVYMHQDGVVIDSQVWSSITLPKLTQMTPGYYEHFGIAMPEIGHIAVFAPAPDTVGSEQAAAVTAHAGEPATARIARVLSKRGIPILIEDGDSEALGPQPVANDMDLIRAAQRTDMGILSEYMFGFRYRPRAARYNLDPAMTVDLATYRYPGDVDPESILTPVRDDQDMRNDWTVSRPQGSSARAIDAAHIKRYGRYDDSAEVQVATDLVLPDQAGWRVRLGTWPKMRYPSTPLHLHANPELVAAWVALTAGDRLDRINTPTQHPPGPVAQIMGGYSETLAPKAWTVDASCLPYGPWEVAEVGGEQRPPADGSLLGSGGLADGGLLFLLTSTAANGPWSVEFDVDYPSDARVGGEQVRLGTPGQILNAHPWIDSGTSGWVGSNATIARSTAQQRDPLYGSLLITPDGTSSSGGANAAARVAVTAGQTYLAGAWVYSPGGHSDLRPAVDWHTATTGGSFISSSLGSAFIVAAGVWTWIGATYTAPATAAGALMRVRHGGTPASSAVWYATQIVLIPTSTYTTSPQTMTIPPGGRGLNGITRGWDAGTPVDVWAPAVLGM